MALIGPGSHRETHPLGRIGWLRAAVLGANDGIISISALLVGMASAGSSKTDILAAGVAGLAAGAISMAAGEYVSVSSQADSEKADLEREAAELAASPEAEHLELTNIYVARGLDRSLAENVATQLMQGNALAAHARDELGITDFSRARPLQAAVASAMAFTAGAVLPLAAALAASFATLVWSVAITSLMSLLVLGWAGAAGGRAPAFIPTMRVVVWGMVALGVTFGAGQLMQGFG